MRLSGRGRQRTPWLYLTQNSVCHGCLVSCDTTYRPRTAGHSISKKFGINVVANESMDLFRGIRSQLASLLDGLDPKDLATMSLGLSHSLSRCALFAALCRRDC